MSNFRKSIVYGFFVLLIVGLLIPVNTIQAGTNEAIDIEAVDTFLSKQVEANRIEGLAVGIVQGDKVIFSKGYGQSAPGKAVTPETQFYIGSVSKTFTALAAIQLVEQGKLDLDAPVRQYLPWFQVADPDASASITIRNLLNHTSGLSEAGDKNSDTTTSSLEEQARLLKEVQLTAPVGTKFQYYNQNYRLLGLIIETVSGIPYSEYIQTRVFEPLGMIHSTTNPQFAPDLAQGYTRLFGFALPQQQTYVPGSLPSGYLISTVDDMTKFLLAEINNKKTDGTPLLSSELLSAMRVKPEGIKTDYGMGWLVLDQGDTIAHGGVTDFFQAFILIHPKEETGLVILINQNSMESMQFENNAIRTGLVDLIQGKQPKQTSYGWIGWLLIALASLDLVNHLRLFTKLKRWTQKAINRKPVRVWVRIILGILIPLFVIFGIPLLISFFKGGPANWEQGFKYAPDLILWMLVGMSLNLLRNILRALFMFRSQK